MKIINITLLGYSAPKIKTERERHIEFYCYNRNNKTEQYCHYIKKSNQSFMREITTRIRKKLLLYEIYLDKIMVQKIRNIVHILTISKDYVY